MQGSNFQYCVLNLFASRSGVCARLSVVCIYIWFTLDSSFTTHCNNCLFHRIIAIRDVIIDNEIIAAIKYM